MQMATGQVGLQGLLARAQLGQELAALHGTSRLPVDPQQLLALMEQEQQVLQQPEGWLHTQGAAQPPKMGRAGRAAVSHDPSASPAAGLGRACSSKAAAKDASAAASAGKLSKLTGLLQASSRRSTASSLPKAATTSSKVAQWAAAGAQCEASPEEEIAAFVSKERKRQGLLPAALVVQSAWRALGPRLWYGRCGQAGGWCDCDAGHMQPRQGRQTSRAAKGIVRWQRLVCRLPAAVASIHVGR
jgi:hypothetical protein